MREVLDDFLRVLCLPGTRLAPARDSNTGRLEGSTVHIPKLPSTNQIERKQQLENRKKRSRGQNLSAVVGKLLLLNGMKLTQMLFGKRGHRKMLTALSVLGTRVLAWK